ncbi:MAG: hypothetical protein ACXVQR_01085, partial [Solirubrobacteraceae bacterium]
RMVQAGDRIATVPYTWGGGHGSFDSAGYDCSGSVSYVLNAGGLLSTLTGRPPVGSSPARSADPTELADVVPSVEWIPGALDPGPRRAIRHRPHVDQTAATLRHMVQAGNRIATLPYTWGGGHGSFDSAGYDCSGSVSYVLHGGGLLSTPMDSSGLEGYGLPGPGRHVTIYANAQHALMVIDGRRFDTIALQETGTRWSSAIGSLDGYTVRHPAGL